MELIKNNQPVEGEPKITFDAIKDRDCMTIYNDDIKQKLVEISGYDLQINFNMQYINSVEDIELAVKGLGDLFRQIITDHLFSNKQKHEAEIKNPEEA